MQLVLPSAAPVLRLTFDRLAFHQRGGLTPELEIGTPTVVFEGALTLLADLQSAIPALADGKRPTIKATASEITASYAIAFPDLPAGVFSLRNVAVRLGLEVPFDAGERKPTVSLGFASRDNPFSLTVSAFGGGGYVDIQIGESGLSRLEASLEFGAAIAIGIGIARAEVHALGGARLVQNPDGSFVVDGFLRVGGSVDVLGLVGFSVELVVTLTYDQGTGILSGRATLVIEVDLFLFSDSIEIDTGTIVIGEDIGLFDIDDGGFEGMPRLVAAHEPDLTAWQAYRRAFAA